MIVSRQTIPSKNGRKVMENRVVKARREHGLLFALFVVGPLILLWEGWYLGIALRRRAREKYQLLSWQLQYARHLGLRSQIRKYSHELTATTLGTAAVVALAMLDLEVSTTVTQEWIDETGKSTPIEQLPYGGSQPDIVVHQGESTQISTVGANLENVWYYSTNRHIIRVEENGMAYAVDPGISLVCAQTVNQKDCMEVLVLP
jgi:hypothetical protein